MSNKYTFFIRQFRIAGDLKNQPCIRQIPTSYPLRTGNEKYACLWDQRQNPPTEIPAT